MLLNFGLEDDWSAVENLFLVSVFRSGLNKTLPEFMERFFKMTLLTKPWHLSLRKLILGAAGLSDSLRETVAMAKNADDLCRARFYAGARLSLDGDYETARAQFEACIATESKCVEAGLVQAELDALPA